MKKTIVTPQETQELNLTAEEIQLRQQEETQAEQEKLAREQAEQTAIAKKASGKQKLLDLGLSEEEVKALIGV